MKYRLLVFGELHSLRSEIDKLIAKLLESGEEDPSQWSPAVDLFHDSGELVIQVDVPGVPPEQLEVTLQGKVVTVSGTKPLHPATSRKGVRFHLVERPTGPFSVKITIDSAVNPREAKAFLRNGLLTIRLPKLEEKRNKLFKIPVVEELPQKQGQG